ncbi:MAG: 2-(1,2-epoxy-1,2-dihydrophenyl)acetyl-CoA isomerase PaaG [Pseudomonadota bacterium]
MSNAEILISAEAGVHEITLNRPDKLNSFNVAMHEQLRTAFEAARDDAACRAVLLTGAGRGFCAGQDLGDRANMSESPNLGSTLERFYNPLVRLMRAMPKPIVCAVNGVAAGAGANVALASDIVFAAKSARFIQAFSKIGLIPDSGGTWFLPHLVGEARAKALAMTGAPLGAEQAADWGLIWQAVDDDKLMETARDQARALASGPTQAYGLIKEALQSSFGRTLSEQLDVESDLQRIAGRTPDYREGVAAFMEKRQPAFTGQPGDET